METTGCLLNPPPPRWSSCPPLITNSTTTTTFFFFYPPSHSLKNPPSQSHHLRFLYYYTTRSRSRSRSRSRQWDSNAETVRNPKFNFYYFRNNDNEEDGDDDDDEENEDDIPSQGSTTGLLDDITDRVYIFKVFRSFGWMLPAIILSMLLATGPTAFLLALAVPLGQSALSLTFDKLVGQIQKSTKRKTRTKKKPFASPKTGVKTGKDQEASGSAKKATMGYQSWVAGNAGSVEKGTQDAPSFSGWDELDNRMDYNMGSMRKKARTTSGSRRIWIEKGKLSRREKRSKTPLLLRLLIAVFPFLGLWTKLL